MEQQIRYASAPDGTRIAYSTMGSGPPVMHIVGWPFSHLREELSISMLRRYYETLADAGTLIRLNFRGSGMSQRTGVDYSQGFTSDLTAVLDALDVEDAYIIGYGIGGGPAAILAAQHPERVRRLVLLNPSLYSPEDAGGSQQRAAISLIQQDWELFTQTMSNMLFGWRSSDEANKMAEVMRACIDADAFRVVDVGAFPTREDVQALMRSIRVPTLVARNETATEPTQEVAEDLTALIPGASLVMLEGPWIITDELAETAAHTALEFFGLRPGQRGQPPRETPSTKVLKPIQREAVSGTAIILFADVVDSTATAGRLGNAVFRERTRQLEDSLRLVIRDAGGVPVEGRTLGDGVLGVFAAAAQALDAALRCREPAERVELQLHLGIHAGDVIHETGNVSGMAVSIAARISDLTAPNEILVSGTVRDLARASTKVTFEDRGEHELKGVEEPVRVYEVRGRE